MKVLKTLALQVGKPPALSHRPRMLYFSCLPLRNPKLDPNEPPNRLHCCYRLVRIVDRLRFSGVVYRHIVAFQAIKAVVD